METFPGMKHCFIFYDENRTNVRNKLEPTKYVEYSTVASVEINYLPTDIPFSTTVYQSKSPSEILRLIAGKRIGSFVLCLSYEVAFSQISSYPPYVPLYFWFRYECSSLPFEKLIRGRSVEERS